MHRRRQPTTAQTTDTAPTPPLSDSEVLTVLLDLVSDQTHRMALMREEIDALSMGVSDVATAVNNLG